MRREGSLKRRVYTQPLLEVEMIAVAVIGLLLNVVLVALAVEKRLRERDPPKLSGPEGPDSSDRDSS